MFRQILVFLMRIVRNDEIKFQPLNHLHSIKYSEAPSRVRKVHPSSTSTMQAEEMVHGDFTSSITSQSSFLQTSKMCFTVVLAQMLETISKIYERIEDCRSLLRGI